MGGPQAPRGLEEGSLTLGRVLLPHPSGLCPAGPHPQSPFHSPRVEHPWGVEGALGVGWPRSPLSVPWGWVFHTPGNQAPAFVGKQSVAFM